MADRFRDFDAFFNEQQRNPVTLKYRGETHVLPPTLPVATVLQLKRAASAGPAKKVSDDMLTALFTSIFGQARYERWAADGMPVDEMLTLLGWALEVYGVSGKAANDPKAETPAAKPKRGRRRG